MQPTDSSRARNSTFSQSPEAEAYRVLLEGGIDALDDHTPFSRDLLDRWDRRGLVRISFNANGGLVARAFKKYAAAAPRRSTSASRQEPTVNHADAITDLRDRLNRQRTLDQLTPGQRVRIDGSPDVLVFAGATIYGPYAAVLFDGQDHPVPMRADTVFTLAD